jgi:hypothetical protein
MIERMVIEADEIAYKAAASIEKTCHVVHFSGGTSVDLGNEHTMTSLRAFYKSKGMFEHDHYTVEIYKAYADESTLIENLKSMITSLRGVSNHVDAAKYNIGKINNLEFWLSNSDRKKNFRYSVAKTEGKNGFGYKAGRGEKPKYIKSALQYLKEIHGAHETDFGEADDAIAIAHDTKSILVSIDKDLLMIPGMHYNWAHDKLFFVPEGIGGAFTLGKKIKPYGLLCFYVQLLCGDPTDNIPGCFNPEKAHHKTPPKFSMEAALKYLQQGDDTENDYFKLVQEVYEKDYQDSWKEVLMEIADLVWICRSKTITGRQYLQSRGYL